MPESEGSETWLSLMRSGNYEAAWKLSDNVLKSGVNRNYLSIPRHYQCIWNGTSLSGKRVLIRCYHGLGDTIMFIRYTRLLKNIASVVIVWAQPKLLELLGTAEGIDKLIPLHDGTPEFEYDADIEIMELPHYFRTVLTNIPVQMPYLHVAPLHLHPGPGGLNVGLVWKAGDWDSSRNIPFHFFEPLFGMKDINLCILQDNPVGAGWQKGLGLHPGECTLFEHARIIAGLDLVITVDSMPAHLAGALKIPAWVLLPAMADWRWMDKRKDSPWYPSIRLFRQKKPGEWDIVIEEVEAELKMLLSNINRGK